MIRKFGGTKGLDTQPKGIALGQGTGGTALANDVVTGKTFTNDLGEGVGTNDYKSGVKVPFNKLKPSAPIQVASFDATNGTYNERMSIVFVTEDGYFFAVQYYGSANSVMVYNKDGVYLSNFTVYVTAIYDFVVYGGYIYAISDATISKYSVNAGYTTITSITQSSPQNDSYRVKRIGNEIFYAKSYNMYKMNLDTMAFTGLGYKAGVSRFYGVDVNNNIWGGNGYRTNIYKYDTNGNLLLTLALATTYGSTLYYICMEYSAERNSMIFISYVEVSSVRRYVIFEYTVAGDFIQSVDLYTIYGLGESVSYNPKFYGTSNGLMLFKCANRLVAIKVSDFSLVKWLQAGAFDCSENMALTNGDYITGSMGNVHFCSSVVAELQ